ncbi:universal stress protein [Amycolatopsis cynarae]|uniref:Universal stress protein n=1 Tax=Amycolatopsis cynarae TaxID=2995223 RepID=A0ABY7BAL2_9PSEU|nr:universal stress protein [Amycolatopsis sp. HUAS 11-8]WAL69407.1 universal stress protein [Amycolatopsis sp. HUAS 11-8]
MTDSDFAPVQGGPPVVVGVDGSATSAAALRWAVAEAAATGRVVRAVAAWTYVPAVDPGGVVAPIDEVAAMHGRALDDFVRETVGERPGAPVRADLVEGDPADALVKASAEASLLVLGSHGRGRLLSALLGSVSAQCLRRAACPVVIISPEVAGEKHEHGTGLRAAAETPGPLL